MNVSPRSLLRALVVAGVLLAAGVPTAALAQAPPPVRVRTGHVVEVASYLAFYAARAKGFHTTFNDSTTLMQAAVSGGLDLFTVGSDAVINVNVRGGAFEFVAGQDNAFSFSLVVGKDIQGFADLKGKPAPSSSRPSSAGTASASGTTTSSWAAAPRCERPRSRPAR